MATAHVVTTVSVYVTLVEPGTTVNTRVIRLPPAVATVTALRVAFVSVMVVSMVTTASTSVMAADSVLQITVSVTVVTWECTANPRAMVMECVLMVAITQAGVNVMPRGEESCARVQVVPAKRKTAAETDCAMLLTMFATAILAGQVRQHMDKINNNKWFTSVTYGFSNFVISISFLLFQ